ncbi:MAG: hypothetical protein Q9226_009291, partial [Calogaya cf. arnoldii]
MAAKSIEKPQLGDENAQFGEQTTFASTKETSTEHDRAAEETSTEHDRAAEKAVNRRCDWHILPLNTLIYMMAALD